jgi:hypothetical protein
LFHIPYADAAAMDPALQGGLIQALERAAKLRPVRLLFEVSDQLSYVPLAVPSFWLETVKRPDLRLEAMSICSHSVGVHMAAKGFRLSNRIRGLKIEVGIFNDVASGRAWLEAPALTKQG